MLGDFSVSVGARTVGQGSWRLKKAASLLKLLALSEEHRLHLIAEVGGVGRDFPLSVQKLSPILAFYVEEGTQQATTRCREVLSYGGPGHTAGIHTRSRRAAVAFGEKMPVSRVLVNTSTAHGAPDLSTALSPSLLLGCWTRGNNITSSDVSPLNLMIQSVLY